LSGYVSGWYDYPNGDVCLAFWKDGERCIERIPFEWYFYLTNDEFEKVRGSVYFRQLVERVKEVDGGKHVRIFSSSRRDDRREFIEFLREDGCEPLEADVSPLMRYMTDVGRSIEFEENLKILFYDLETDPRPGFENLERQRILSVAFNGIDRKTKCIDADSDDDRGEGDLLEQFLEVVEQHDLLVAWNGEKFDDVVLKARCKRIGLNPDWRMINFLDFMQLFKHPYFGYGRDAENKGVKVSYALGNIAQNLLGKKKVEGVPGHMMHKMWRTNRKLVRKYNKVDVDLMVELEDVYGYIDALKILSHMSNRFVSQWVLKVGYLNDAFILRYGSEHGIRFPTKMRAFYEDHNKSVDKFQGAYVMEPVEGMHDEVFCLDFASLYPNVIRSFNISPETKIGHRENAPGFCEAFHCEASNGVVFDMTEEGVFPAIVAMTMERRAKYKKLAAELKDAGKERTVDFRRARQRSDANKLSGNGAYGCLGSPWLRYYDRDCAEAVTLTSQEITRDVIISLAESTGIQVLYSDTDSVYLRCSMKQAEEFVELAADAIDEFVRSRGGIPGFIRLEIDDEYVRVIYLAKKRYVGLKKSGVIDVKGLEYIRTDGCRIERKLQEEIIDYVLHAQKPAAQKAERIAEDWRDRIYDKEVDVEDLTIAKSVSRHPKTYKSANVHVRVAQSLIDRGREFYVGMKIPYVVTGKKDDKLDAVHADDFDGEFDVDYYWQKKVWPPAERVLEAVFPNHDWKQLGRARNDSQCSLFG